MLELFDFRPIFGHHQHGAGNMEYPRAAGCLLAYLSATSNPADTFKLHALSDKTYLIRHADTFHFLTPLRFSKGGDCSGGTYGRRGCSTPGRLPRRHRLRSLGPTFRMRGRRRFCRRQRYQLYTQIRTRNTGMNAKSLIPSSADGGNFLNRLQSQVVCRKQRIQKETVS